MADANPPSQNPSNQNPNPSPVPQETPVSPPPASPSSPGAGVPDQQIKLALKKQQEKNRSRKIFFGCLGFIGLVLVFFFVAAILFLSQVKANDPILNLLRVSVSQLRVALINLTNIGFGILAFIAFIMSIIGLFKSLMTKKEDTAAKKSGLILLILGFISFVVFIFLWISAYLYLSTMIPQQDERPLKNYIITTPADLNNLSAPILVTFDAGKLPIDAGYKVNSYQWDFGDKSPVQFGQKISHTYKQKGTVDGKYQVILTINYVDLGTGEAKKAEVKLDVFIPNENVIAEFSVKPEEGEAPLKVSLDASDSLDPDGEILKYEWDLNNDNDFTDVAGKTADYTFDKVGKYKIQLRVTDNTGQYAVAEKEVNVLSPKKPIAVIFTDNPKNKFYAGEVYTFEAEKSESPFGNIVKYNWDFGDKTKETTRTVKHVFEEKGSYTIKLEVTDETGLTGETELQIVAVPPITVPEAVIITNPPLSDKSDVLIGSVPFAVNFDGSKSLDTDGNIVDYKWDLNGDEKIDKTGANVNYVYNEIGEFNVTLFVTDSDNNESKATLKVTTEAQALRAKLTAAPIEGEVPLLVSLDASGSTYPEGNIVSYKWQFGDDDTASPRLDRSTVKYKYKKTGTFTAKVTVIASDGKEAAAQINITVRPVALKSCFEANTKEGKAPLTVTFDPNCSTGTIVKYLWNFQGATSREKKPTYTFQNPGIYDITLQVTDNDNLVDEYSDKITVQGEIKDN